MNFTRNRLQRAHLSQVINLFLVLKNTVQRCSHDLSLSSSHGLRNGLPTALHAATRTDSAFQDTAPSRQQEESQEDTYIWINIIKKVDFV